MKGEFKTRDPIMAKYLQKVQAFILEFKSFEIFHIPRAKNARADALSQLATLIADSLERIYIEHLDAPSIDKSAEVHQVEHKSSWMDSIIKYLIDEVLLSDPIEVNQIRWMAFQYKLINRTLYKKSFTLPLLKYLGPIDHALRKVHEDICENNLGERSLAYKILRQGYY